jgi:hypothetical protein
MTQDSIAIAERRQRIEDYQQNGINYVNPGPQTVKSLGRLASEAPGVATMLAEGIDDVSTRINALVEVGSSTGEVGPLYDAIAIAQSTSAIEDPKKRSAKLGYVARHAARVDRPLALDTARSIESPTTRARSLMHLTPYGSSEETNDLLREVAHIIMEPESGAALDGSFYWQYLRRTVNSGNYRLGFDVCERRTTGRTKGEIRNYPREEDMKRHRYAADCVIDAFENSQRDYRDLAPIAEEVVELFGWCAQAGFTSSTRYRDPPFPSELGSYYNLRERFHLITEGLKIAESFAQVDDKRSSRALLRTLKKLIDNSIKDPLPERL